MLKLGARQKFGTALAWEFYQVHKTYKATAAALSAHLKCEISDSAVSERFKKEGLSLHSRRGRPIKPDSMTSSERSRKCRERKALQALSSETNA